MPVSTNQPIRVYVGADRSQQLAIAVLEYSIKRHTGAEVQVVPMVDLPVPLPRDPRNGQRTGFSFSRFCIPKLAGYSGRAIYMDADMLVLRDIRELWDIPFDGCRVVIQKEVKYEAETTAKAGAPAKRRKQCAVMLLDCARLDWDISAIVADMDAGRYGYEELMYELCVLREDDIKYGVPFEWNSLEHWDAETRLIHYTDVNTQPWTHAGNPNGQLWFDEVRRMLADGALSWETLQGEIAAGFFRPSLARDIRWRHRLPRGLWPLWDRLNALADKVSGYQPHKAVNAAKRARLQGIREYEAAQAARGAPEQRAGQPQ
jgi:hypothetical protein